LAVNFMGQGWGDMSLPQKNHIRVWALWDQVASVIAVAHQLILWITFACLPAWLLHRPVHVALLQVLPPAEK
jgi:hypothetical protein